MSFNSVSNFLQLRPYMITSLSKCNSTQLLCRLWANTCQVVDPNQFGAVWGSSTTLALLQILQRVYQATYNSKNYARLLIDFSKAFDHIDHQILLQKLDQNGVHPLIQKWYYSFLQGRQQRAKMGKPTSEWVSVNEGVPQGTLGGPNSSFICCLTLKLLLLISNLWMILP